MMQIRITGIADAKQMQAAQDEKVAKTFLTGLSIAGKTYRNDDLVTLPDDTAQRLIDGGFAVFEKSQARVKK